jgi:hypothetical protein
VVIADFFPRHVLACRYGLPADLYSFGVTLVEVAVGHTPYVDLSFEQIAIKKVTCNTVPMLAVDAHGKRFSEVTADEYQLPSCMCNLQCLCTGSGHLVNN